LFRIDAATRIGRERGNVMLGPLLAVIVAAASIGDNTAGADLCDSATTAHPTLARTGVYAGLRPPQQPP
jgi:hypothetical protein